MRRMIGALLLGLTATAVAHAHALYVVADGSDPAKLTIVFSDDLSPDARVKATTWKKLESTKLTARTADGKTTEVKSSTGEHCLKASAPAGTQVIYGQVDYGVSTKSAKPSHLMFYPKAIVGAIPADGGKTGVPLEIVPSVGAGKVRFQVLASGKPVAGASVVVMLPEPKDEKDDATTDEQGFTSGFAGKGRFGVTVRHIEAKAGELNGQKFEQKSLVATLVVDVK